MPPRAGIASLQIANAVAPGLGTEYLRFIRAQPSHTHCLSMHPHRFTDAERRLLLSEPGIGPQVVQRIEASGVHSIRELCERGVGSVVDTVCDSVGSKAWANRRDALTRVIARVGATDDR